MVAQWAYPRGCGGTKVSQKFVDGELITVSDLQATIESGVTVSAMGDRIDVDSTRHVIKRIVPIPAAGTAAAYTISFAG